LSILCNRSSCVCGAGRRCRSSLSVLV